MLEKMEIVNNNVTSNQLSHLFNASSDDPGKLMLFEGLKSEE